MSRRPISQFSGTLICATDIPDLAARLTCPLTDLSSSTGGGGCDLGVGLGEAHPACALVRFTGVLALTSARLAAICSLMLGRDMLF